MLWVIGGTRTTDVRPAACPATTVAQIAVRAGLTKSTFFRHFADKREVLFGGQDLLVERFGAAIQGTPPAATAADCLAAAMAQALRARGADDTTARLAAELGILAFSTAYARSAAPENRQPFAEIARATLRDPRARAAALGEGASVVSR